MGISSVTSQVSPDLLIKALAMLSDTTVRRLAVDWEGLKPYWKLENWPHFSRGSTSIYTFFKDFTTHKKKTNRVVVSSCWTIPSILKYRDHWWDLPLRQFGKQDSFKHISKSLASMYESSCSQFLRTTTGI